MNETLELSQMAKVAIAFRIQDLRGVRACAATVLARYASEYLRYGYNPGLDNAKRIAKRFRLGDFYNTLLVRS